MFSLWLCSILVPIWISLFFYFKCNKKYGIGFAAVLFLLAALALDGSKTSVGETIIIVLVLNIVPTVIFFVSAGLVTNKISSEKASVVLPMILTAVIMFILFWLCQYKQESDIKDSFGRSYEAKKSFEETKKRETENALLEALQNFETRK